MHVAASRTCVALWPFPSPPSRPCCSLPLDSQVRGLGGESGADPALTLNDQLPEAVDLDTMTEDQVVEAARKRAGEMMTQFGFHQGEEEDEFVGFGNMVDNLFELQDTTEVGPPIAAKQGGGSKKMVRHSSQYLPVQEAQAQARTAPPAAAPAPVAPASPMIKRLVELEEEFDGFGSSESIADTVPTGGYLELSTEPQGGARLSRRLISSAEEAIVKFNEYQEDDERQEGVADLLEIFAEDPSQIQECIDLGGVTFLHDFAKSEESVDLRRLAAEALAQVATTAAGATEIGELGCLQTFALLADFVEDARPAAIQGMLNVGKISADVSVGPGAGRSCSACVVAPLCTGAKILYLPMVCGSRLPWRPTSLFTYAAQPCHADGGTRPLSPVHSGGIGRRYHSGRDEKGHRSILR